MASGPMLPQYVDPRVTEGLYSNAMPGQVISSPPLMNSIKSECLSTPIQITPRPLLRVEAQTSPYHSESTSPASISSPGILTPTSSMSSHSQHSFYSHGDQCNSFGEQPSPTPLRRRRKSSMRRPTASQMRPFHTLLDSQMVSADTGPADSVYYFRQSQESFPNRDILFAKADSEWQQPCYQPIDMDHHDQKVPLSVQGCLGMDLTPEFNASVSSDMVGAQRQQADANFAKSWMSPQSRISRDNGFVMRDFDNIAPAMLSNLEPNSPLSISDSDLRIATPRPETVRPCPKVSKSQRAGRKRGASLGARKKTAQHLAEIHYTECTFVFPPPEERKEYYCGHPGCSESFKRIEHARRHERKHTAKENSVLLRCPFAAKAGEPHWPYNCVLPENGIKDRPDNMQAHLLKCHCQYGKDERLGKQRRYSMKASRHVGVQDKDERWSLFVNNKLEFGDDNRYYKMLGYSIKETQELQVKDVLPPDGSPPNETSLKDLDPRWKRLLSGAMTFEEAITRGKWMPETEAEGVLGVDMMTSEEMGLRGLDPRWRRLDDGDMTLEEAQRYHVAHLFRGSAARPMDRPKVKSNL